MKRNKREKDYGYFCGNKLSRYEYFELNALLFITGIVIPIGLILYVVFK